jgi:toxin secretion/phage lysis holin
MKETSLKALLAVIAGGVAAYFNVLAIPLAVLMVAMAVDYISGMTKAWVTGELSSRVGVLGIIKKVGYLTVICVAAIVDWLLMSGLHKVGISVGMDFCFGVMCTIWFIINECISILENLAVIGVPLPRFLTAMIKRLAAVVDEKGDEKTKE